MTQEQKAKAYDEALERARMYRDNAKAVEEYSAVARYENIFPELRENESEDERIRKWLADYFSSIKATVWIHRDITCEQILEWLEKQKEQKPVEEQFPPLEGLDAIKAKYYDDGFKNGFDEGVASVKPTWSEELDIDTLREWSMRYAPDIRQAIESTAYHFYNIRPHWKPSEEQMAGLLVAIGDEKERGSDVVKTLRSLYEQLKKL